MFYKYLKKISKSFKDGWSFASAKGRWRTAFEIILCLLAVSFTWNYDELSSQPDKAFLKTERRHTKKIIPNGYWQKRYEINFGRHRKPELAKVIYFNELEAAARNRNLNLRPDLPLRGLQDFEGEAIESHGLTFFLDVPRSIQSFLYLDIAVYIPQSMDAKKEPQTQPVTWLEVKINGRQAALFYRGGPKVSSQSPLVVPIAKEWITRDRTHFLLKPSPHANDFVIWDAFISQTPSGVKSPSQNRFDQKRLHGSHFLK